MTFITLRYTSAQSKLSLATNLLATWLRRTRITVRHGHRLLNLREPACVVGEWHRRDIRRRGHRVRPRVRIISLGWAGVRVRAVVLVRDREASRRHGDCASWQLFTNGTLGWPDRNGTDRIGSEQIGSDRMHNLATNQRKSEKIRLRVSHATRPARYTMPRCWVGPSHPETILFLICLFWRSLPQIPPHTHLGGGLARARGRALVIAR